MTCPYCKSEMAPQPLGYVCEAKTGEGKHVCGASVGNTDRVRKDVKS